MRRRVPPFQIDWLISEPFAGIPGRVVYSHSLIMIRVLIKKLHEKILQVHESVYESPWAIDTILPLKDDINGSVCAKSQHHIAL